METAPVRASPASPRVRRALRLVIVAGGATLAVGAALVQPFGASHLFPMHASPSTVATALPPPPPPAATPAAHAEPQAIQAPTIAAIVPAPPPTPALSARSPAPPVAPSSGLPSDTIQQASPQLRAVAPPRSGVPPPPREPLPLQTDLIEPATPAEPSGAKAAAPSEPAAGDQHG